MTDKAFASRIKANEDIYIYDLDEAAVVIKYMKISEESHFVRFEDELERMDLQETQRLLQQAKGAGR